MIAFIFGHPNCKKCAAASDKMQRLGLREGVDWFKVDMDLCARIGWGGLPMKALGQCGAWAGPGPVVGVGEEVLRGMLVEAMARYQAEMELPWVGVWGHGLPAGGVVFSYPEAMKYLRAKTHKLL